MKKSKKIILAIMCLGMIACLVACNADNGSTGNTNPPNQWEQESTAPPNQNSEEDKGDENSANNNGSNGDSTLPEQGWTDVRK